MSSTLDFSSLTDRDLREAIKLGCINYGSLKPEAQPDLKRRIDALMRERDRRDTAKTHAGKLAAFVILFAALALPAYAHQGFVGKNGCHVNTAAKRYECHKGPLAGRTFGSKAEADAAMVAADHTFTPTKSKDGK